MGQQAYTTQARPVRLLAAGGTISMQGEHAVPTLDAAGLVAAIPELARFEDLTAENVLGLPGPQISLEQGLELVGQAAGAAARGEGTVITTGTDTLEELAMLGALLHDGEAPVVFTGANRPASAPGADGPANLLDAVAVAAAPAAAGLGTLVVFGGEILAATAARKVESTGPSAFGAPVAGPIGRVVEGRLWLHARPVRHRTLKPTAITHNVAIVSAALGERGDLLRAAAETADGVVVEAFGAGHLTPGMLHALHDVVARLPVVITVAPERGSMMHATYGFEGAERDVRSSGAVCAPFLSARAARIALLCCLGAGLDRDAIATALAPWDA
ncbi:MAG TPA: asparaginase domain-containing protein [Solirubrobacteraceae bacterium]|nr:asparaginase domain-containing protein [Solirubrobacteraceae bacterium]